jgi:hypothetical protein
MERIIMTKLRKIGWQKYEDNIEDQMNSPLTKLLMTNFLSYENEEEAQEENLSEEENRPNTLILTVSNQIAEQIQLVSNFDCWIGHTNFNLTEDIKRKINKIEGVEILKIYSRYRFFIGIGKMFNFTEVRKNIEAELTPGLKD